MPEQNGIPVAVNFTAEPIAAALHFWIRRLGCTDEVRFAPYDQIFQALPDEHGPLVVADELQERPA